MKAIRKNGILILLAILFALALMPKPLLVAGASSECDAWDGTVGSGFTSGSGSSTDPYLIYTAEELAYLSWSVNSGTTYESKYFKLMNDIDLCGIEWTPIGVGTDIDTFSESTVNCFMGVFDGDFHTVSNIKITQPHYGNIGLFGRIVYGSVSKLGVENVDINVTVRDSYAFFGALCGIAYNATFAKCYSTGSIVDTNPMSDSWDMNGGLVGALCVRSYAQNCYSTCDLTVGTMRGGNYGGIFGYINSGNETAYCYSAGNIVYNAIDNNVVEGEARVGGFVGFLSGSLKSGFTASNIYSEAQITKRFGNFAGFESGSMRNVYYSKDQSLSHIYYANGYETDPANFISEAWLKSNLYWDTEAVWEVKPGASYPTLRGFVGSEAVTPPDCVHFPNDDDGDCTTAITCTLCGKVLTSAYDGHSFNDALDESCNNPGCEHTRMIAKTGKILIVQDRDPWNKNSSFAVMENLMYRKLIDGYEIVTSSQFLNIDLSEYSVIQVLTDDNSISSSSANNIFNQVTAFASAGGSVIYSISWQSSQYGYNLPYGVTAKNYPSDHKNIISDPDHPIITGVLSGGNDKLSSPVTGNQMSISYIHKDSLPANTNIIFTGEHSENPTLVEFPYGNGNVIITCQAWGFHYTTGIPQHQFANTYYDDVFVYALALAEGEINAPSACDHSFTAESTPATCTDSGLYREICSMCGFVGTYSYIPSLGHSFESEVTKEAACGEPGCITYTCTREDCLYSYIVSIYTEHNYEMTVIEPTCNKDGATIYTCKKCGDVNRIDIPASHNYASEVTKTATRYEDGEITYTCIKCADSYTEVIPASNANILVIQDAIPWGVNSIPTLLNEMKDNGYITGWTMTTTAGVDMLELTSFDVILIANDQSTSTYDHLRILEDSLTDFALSGGTLIYGACDHGWSGGSISFTLPGGVEKSNFYSMHNYIVDSIHPIVTGSLTDDRALTNELLVGTYCSHTGFVSSTLPDGYNIILQDGEGNATLAEYPMGEGRVILSGLTWEFYYSRIYSGSTSYSINAFDDLIAYAVSPVSSCEHRFDEGVAVSATCDTEGYTLHTCSECGRTYKDNYVKALGHEMGEWIIDYESTCSEQGSKYQTCARCFEKVTEVIPVKGHTVGEFIIDKEASAGVDGSMHKECSECGRIIVTETIPALPECDHVEELVDVPAGCTSSGYTHAFCLLCGEDIGYYYIPSLGHSYVSRVAKEATCTEPGVINYTCTREGCSDFYYVETYSEHDYEIKVVEPSCISEGATVYTCTKCGSVNVIAIPASHSLVSEVTKPATRYDDGEIVYTCTVCGISYKEIIPASNANVLVIQDTIPWSENNIPKLLNSMKNEGYITGWTMTTTASIGMLELSSFDLILIANDQTTATYNELRLAEQALVDFTLGGGTLIYGACDHGWSAGNISFPLPGGAEKHNFYSMHNYISDPTHPIVTGSLTDDRAITNELLVGTYCSHTGFIPSTLPDGYNIIIQDGEGNATLAEYPLGEGRVILSGLTWEFYYSRIYSGSTSYSMNVFDDLIAYAVSPVSSCNHKFDGGESVRATCETEGYTLHTCSECGRTYKDNYVKALGHEMGEWTVDLYPSCTVQGSKHQECARCLETVTEVIPENGHILSDYIFDDFGNTKFRECTVCHEIIIREPAFVTHTVTFLDYKGEIICTITLVHGDSAEYNGDIPIKPEDNEASYRFIGWDKPIDNVTDDITVVAVFERIPHKVITGIVSPTLGDIEFTSGTDSSGLPDKTVLTLSDGTTLEVSIVWDTSAFDPEKLGTQTVLGTIIIPDGFICEIDTNVSVKVTVTEALPEGGYLELFESQVNAITGGTMEIRYDTIIKAAISYNRLTDGEKETAAELYSRLVALAEEYNTEAEALNEGYDDALKYIMYLWIDQSELLGHGYLFGKEKEI